MKSETADLQTRLWAAWQKDLPTAQRAAGVVDEGAGRLGRRRRQVRDASDELTAFAQRWRPVHPDLPTAPVELARRVRWLHGHRIEDQIDAYVTGWVAEAHPDADDVRQAERPAWAAFEIAEKARTRLDNALYEELRPYGRAAHVTDPGQQLTTVTDELAIVERDLRTATAQVGRLQNEPAIRELPSDGLDTEHSQWAADRGAQRQTAARQAQLRPRRPQPAHGIGSSHPGHHPALDHGPSIGR